MPNSKLSKITLPNNTTYDIRDGYAMHFVGETTTALAEGATTNPIIVDGTNYTARMGDYVKTTSGSPYIVTEENSGSTNNVVWSSLGSATGGTVTSIGASGVGIQTSKANNGAISDSGTLSLKLEANSTSGTQAATQKGNTANREYAVGTDSNGVLSVNVPWANDNTTYTFATGTTNGSISVTPSGGSASDVAVKGLKTAAYKDTTDLYSSTGTDPITGTGVAEALATLPSPMVFKGTVGTGGTIASLPVNGTATIGDTYKVITDGTYASQAAKAGDTFICQTKTSSANTWAYIPSGDEPSGTVTNIATGVGLTGGPITSTGTIKANLKSETASSLEAAAKGSTASREYAVGLDSNSKLSVNIPWTDTTYTAANNGGLTLTGTAFSITNSISAQSTAALKKITFDAHGQITGTADPSKATVSTGLDCKAPGATAPANSQTYYSVSGETLSLYQIGYNTNANVVTN